MGQILKRERLVAVHPNLIAALERIAPRLPYNLLVSEGVRDNETQARYYAQGRFTPGKIITDAQTAADSAHGWGLALDVLVLVDGKTAPDGHFAWAAWGAEVEREGMGWGGRFANFDGPHMQMPNWRALKGWNGWTSPPGSKLDLVQIASAAVTGTKAVAVPVLLVAAGIVASYLLLRMA